MKILKSRSFFSHELLTQFVNDNNIVREDIFAINRSGSSVSECAIFFYADPDIKEKTRNMWGKLED